ncbi:non-specific lipid-transfer protein AP10-like [Rhodamnia argentea]|uniref:Non-specific lipid-transfer protein AP10-like n=1 Tax=Rhodamnia argentea TaxID=178133 RepID=A0A8B8QVI1_9MYRT|nr:non-specific lipid-transfer protein AP10-like [Rhodamnia argentea]
MGSTTSNRQLAAKVLFFLIIMFMSSNPANSITCQDALKVILPCGPFALGTVPPPPSAACCSGAHTLASMADSTEARRTLCQCYKDIPPSVGIKPERVQQIPQYCKVDVTIPTDPHVDCSSIP